MRFAVETQFGITADVLSCPDPWGQITFHVHRYGSKRHRTYLRARMKEDPLSNRTMAKLLKRGLAAANSKQEPKPVSPDAGGNVIDVGVVAPATQEATFADEYQHCFVEAVSEALDRGEITVFEMNGNTDKALDEVLALLEGWDAKYEDGSPVPFTRENALELLTTDTVVKDGQPFEGETVGDVLVKHLQEFAQAHDVTRRRYLEAAEKNSEGSSAGA